MYLVLGTGCHSGTVALQRRALDHPSDKIVRAWGNSFLVNYTYAYPEGLGQYASRPAHTIPQNFP